MLRRWAARLGLAIIAAAALFGLWLPEVGEHKTVWPLATRHLLPNVALVLAYVALGAGLLFALLVIVVTLWTEAQ
jgi:hypothetical protein